MGTIYQSLHQFRRSKIMGQSTLTGIDYLEVSPNDQHKLQLHFIPIKRDQNSIPPELLSPADATAKIKHLVVHRAGQAFHLGHAVADLADHPDVLLHHRGLDPGDLAFNFLQD